MTEREEEMLRQMKVSLDQISIPLQLNDHIQKGIERGKNKRQRSRHYLRLSSLAASLLIVAFLSAMKFSPTVAAYVGQIPGIGMIEKWMHNDKGIKLAVENNFMQSIHAADVQDGVEFAIDGLIVDESRLLMFYSIDYHSASYRPFLDRIQLFDGQDKPWDGNSMNWGSNYDDKNKMISGSIDIQFAEMSEIPDQLNLQVQMAAGSGNESAEEPLMESRLENQLPYKWTVAVPIDKKRFEGLKEVYNVNQTVEAEGQQMTIKQVTIYPTRTAIEMTFDENNSKKILGFDDLRLVDEKGETFGSITNGIVSSQQDSAVVVYAQSNYFAKPESLYLELTSMRALDFDQLDVAVDIEKQELLNRPDEQLELTGIQRTDNGLRMDFVVNSDDPRDQNYSYIPFSSIMHDRTGKEYQSGSSSTSSEDNRTHIQYYLAGKEFSNPLILHIDQYPSRIHGKIKVKVK